MSDWVKTQNGWEQSSGNGISREELNGVKQELNNSAYTQMQTTSACTLICGGYRKIGSLVVLNARFRANQTINDYTILSSGLPKSDYGDNITMFNTNKSGLNGFIYGGNLGISTIGGTVNPINAGTDFIICGCYISNQ